MSYASDRAEIADLMARYLFAMDYNDYDAYAECFAEDGELDYAMGTTRGREAIRAEARVFKDNVARLFETREMLLAGWLHYLAFDLFVGLWIARDADAKGFSRLVQLPILFLTLMAGPIGLLIWLLVRERRARAAAKASV